MTDELNALREAIRKYVERGGQDAFAFSLIHEPEFNKIPGQVIQLEIDSEIYKKEKGLFN